MNLENQNANAVNADVEKKKSNKNVIIILVVVAIILALITGGVVAIIKFANKELVPITGEQFKVIMEAKGYAVVDATDQFEGDIGNVVYIAIDPQNQYQLEFYDLYEAEDAIRSYNLNKQEAQLGKTNVSGESTVSGKNFNKYNLTTNNILTSLVRVENTFTYYKGSPVFKNNIQSMLKEMGY